MSVKRDRSDFRKTVGRTLVYSACTLLLVAAVACSESKMPAQPNGADATSANEAPVASSEAPAPSVSPTPTVASPKSSTVSSPFQLNLSQAALNTILLQGAVMKSLQGEIKQTLPDSSIGSPFSVTISGIHLDLKYNFNTPKLNAATQQWDFTTKEISADLTVDSVTANETVQEGTDGATIDVRINASCSPVHLILPSGSSSATGTIQLGLEGGKPTLQLTSFTPSWTPNAWQVSAINCQGASGFGALVSQQASQMLSQVNPFVDAMQQEIESELSSLVAGPIHFEMNIAPDISVALSAEKFNSPSADKPGPVGIQGRANFNFLNIPRKLGCEKWIAPYDGITLPSADPTVAGNMLSLPLETVQALINCSYYNHELEVQFTSAQVQSFKSLVSCWLEDILVWPDLLGFKGSSVFGFKMQTTGAPSFGDAREVGPHQIALNANLPLELEIDAPVDNLEPYVRFQTDFVGAVQMNVSNNQAVIHTVNNSGLKLGYQFDPNYVAAHHPDERIWLQPIESAANNYLSSTGLTFPLPTLKVSEDLTLIPQSADLDGTNVDLAIKLVRN
jgi:hypothetical protein